MAVFVIDTSSLVGLQEWRPRGKNERVWRHMLGLIRNDRLIAPDEVYHEFRGGKGPLQSWVQRRKREGRLFRSMSRGQYGIARQIIHRFHELVDYERPGVQADPFVVALAVHESKAKLAYDSCIVVTEEKFTPHGRPRIPHVCEAHGLQYVSIHQMFLKMRADEGWEF